MSIPRKGTRIVEIDGRSFRYKIRMSHEVNYPKRKELLVTVQENVSDPGNVLQFRSSYLAPLTPGFLVSVVRQALSLGWAPEKRGRAFIMPQERPFSPPYQSGWEDQ